MRCTRNDLSMCTIRISQQIISYRLISISVYPLLFFYHDFKHLGPTRDIACMTHGPFFLTPEGLPQPLQPGFNARIWRFLDLLIRYCCSRIGPNTTYLQGLLRGGLLWFDVLWLRSNNLCSCPVYLFSRLSTVPFYIAAKRGIAINNRKKSTKILSPSTAPFNVTAKRRISIIINEPEQSVFVT